jgi:hypothetical protein
MEYVFNKQCNPDLLKNEIEQSTIKTALAAIQTSGSETKVIFKAELDSTDEDILSQLILDHVNGPTPQDVLEVAVINRDPDTEGLMMSPKYAPNGWHQQLFETEFTTSKLNSVHEKDWMNNDIGWSVIKFYDANDNELDTQDDIDLYCVRSDLAWMPTKDYMIKAGFIAQVSAPNENVYAWCLGADLIPAYGGPQAVFCEGGINLDYVNSRERIGLNGVAGTRLDYNGGIGSNRIRFVFRHPAGFKHRVQCAMEIFIEP